MIHIRVNKKHSLQVGYNATVARRALVRAKGQINK